MRLEYEFLKHQTDEIKRIIEFFVSFECNKDFFQEIVEKCIDNPFVDIENEKGLLHMGYLSPNDYHHFYGEKASNYRLVWRILELLTGNSIIEPFNTFMLSTGSFRYKPVKDYSKFLYERDLILNLIFGALRIVDKYCENVVIFELKYKSGNPDIGTGFFINIGTEINPQVFIVTNHHVVSGCSDDKLEKLTIRTSNDEILFDNLFYTDFIVDEINDIALIEYSKERKNCFYLSEHINLLDEIITIGYPPIPQTDAPYQIIHKGEINSFVKAREKGRELIIFSAKTAGGNSGGPIIDNYGLVVGIVSDDCLNYDDFLSKAKLPYHAATPSEKINKLLHEKGFLREDN